MENRLYALVTLASLALVSPQRSLAAGPSSTASSVIEGSGAPSVHEATRNEARQFAIDALASIKAARGWAMAEIGEGLEVFTIPDASLVLVDEQIPDLALLYEPLGMWAFPVATRSSGSPDHLLMVRRGDKRWSLALYADPVQARHVSEIARAWPTSRGYDHKLISASALDQRLVEISQNGRVIGLVRSFSAPDAHFDPAALRNPSEAAIDVQAIAKSFNESRRGR